MSKKDVVLAHMQHSKKDECPKIALANYYYICEVLVLVSKVEEH